MTGLLPRLYRLARSGAYGLLEPLDFGWRVLNRMTRYPPLRLRRHAGSLGVLDGPGQEFVALLKLLCGLKPGWKIWDIGCGCGLLELALEDARWEGTVIGTDIHRPSIAWARRTISSRRPDFAFRHMDVRHQAYWPQGRLTARRALEDFPDRDFDLVVAKSFFTHVLPDELDVYLSAIGPRLREGGRALLTFFVLDHGRDEAEMAGRPALRFIRRGADGEFGIRSPLAPSAAVAYDRAFLLGRLGAHGLVPEGGIRKGWWRGDPGGLSFQDIIVARVAAPPGGSRA